MLTPHTLRLGLTLLFLQALQVGRAAEPGFAVVELFTSEGCSSCPPADRLLRELAARQDRGEPLYVIGYHVDYWNQLGWPDRFSTPAMTERQRAYAAALEADTVYTPQMIVNGTTSFVGSNRQTLETALKQALRQPRGPAKVTLGTPTPSKPDDQLTDKETGWTIPVRVAGLERPGLVVVVAVQHAATSQVTRGENQGERLVHRAVARSLKTLAVEADGDHPLELELPPDFPYAKSKLVAWVHDRASARILAVSEQPLPERQP
jgi:hypothetical protein